MYTIKFGYINNLNNWYNLHIDDPDGTTIVVNPTLSKQLNAAGSLTFTMLPNHPYYSAFRHRLYLLVDVFDDDGKNIWRGRTTDFSIDFYAQKNVTCEGALSFLADSIQRPHEYKKVTVKSFLQSVINQHNTDVKHVGKQITLGSIAREASLVSGITNYDTSIEAISNILIAKWGGFIEVVVGADGGLVLNYKTTSGSRINQPIEFGENLIDFTRDQRSSEIYTAIIPLGASVGDSSGVDNRITIKSVNNNVDYLTRSDLVNYSWVYRVMENSDIETASELKTWAQEQLNALDWESMIIEVSAVDLNMLNPAYKPFDVGEIVNVKSEPHNVDIWLPIAELNINIADPTQSSYVLGIEKDTRLSGLMR